MIEASADVFFFCVCVSEEADPMGVLHLASEGPLSCVALETNPGTRDGDSHNKQTADSWFEHADSSFFLSPQSILGRGADVGFLFYFHWRISQTDTVEDLTPRGDLE